MAQGGTTAPTNTPFGQQQPNAGGDQMQAFNETGERRQPMQQQQFGSYQPMQLPMQQQPDTSTVSHFGDAQYRPQVEQQPASFDPRAIAGDPQGFPQYMQQMQQR